MAGRNRTGRRFIPAGAGNTTVHKRRAKTKTVYPRWRGEHSVLRESPSHRRGLSPLARGTRTLKSYHHCGIWFIPAGAGNTPAHGDQNQSTPVYPRWRGEHEQVRIALSPSTGLSPLARGTLADTLGKVSGQRFIPAGAGNTSLRHY